MSEPEKLSLELAGPHEQPRISNLMQLYLHDMSETFPLDPNEAGCFVYDKLPLYWSAPKQRFPFLIREGARVAGFALVTRGSPASDNPSVFDMAEFFVLRRLRRTGVGRRAAFALWDRFQGTWIVRVSEGNQRAMAFWPRTIADYTGGTASTWTRQGSPFQVRVFEFPSSPDLSTER